MPALKTFEYSHNGVTLKGQLALPAGVGPHPGVLVMHEARGLGEHVRQRALRLADNGYVALATDMYGDGQFFENPLDAGPAFSALANNPQLLRARVVAAFHAFRTLTEVDPERVGAIGFCFGGRCVLELARSGADVKGVVSFHGLLNTELPARTGDVKAKVLAMTGACDPFAPAEHVQIFREEMANAGVDLHLTIYSEGWHAFTSNNSAALSTVPGVRYDALLDRLSWAQGVTFLDALLRG